MRETLRLNKLGRTKGKHWKVKDNTNLKGRHPSSEFEKGQNLAGSNNKWRGDAVGYDALHSWIKRRLAKPMGCNHCGNIKPLDLANKCHAYRRDLTDWLWLCKKCHAKYDNNYPQSKKNPKFYNRWTNTWDERRVQV